MTRCRRVDSHPRRRMSRGLRRQDSVAEAHCREAYGSSVQVPNLELFRDVDTRRWLHPVVSECASKTPGTRVPPSPPNIYGSGPRCPRVIDLGQWSADRDQLRALS